MRISGNLKGVDRLNEYADAFRTILEHHNAELKDDTPESVIYLLHGSFFYIRLVDWTNTPYITLNSSCNGEIINISTNISKTTLGGSSAILENFIETCKRRRGDA